MVVPLFAWQSRLPVARAPPLSNYIRIPMAEKVNDGSLEPIATF
ncbi:hypothetical protein THTE_2114 [Thermogutta terrifontis]|uniref:Uncharacterized protein n=1 Tax=Thermogutta terrifontis TaxID=1331910 RepID=A0A286RFI0_9BACT|nr:hypothetical protein THTE_2114 [Thermogutta terrifontis]